MLRIGIITLVGNENFGNKLQNYALQHILEDLGCVVETINVDSKDFKDKLYGRKWVFLRNVKRFSNKLILKSDYKYRNREKKFINFSKEYLNETSNMSNVNSISTDVIKYDKICFGSDQIWSPYNSIPFFISLGIFGKYSNIDMFSYAASFGVYNIPMNVKKYYIEGLKNIKSISVRENQGKNIIENLGIEKNIEVLIDPTMLLKKEEWDKIAKKPINFNIKNYILMYFLGEINDDIKKEIERVADENNCKIINILDKNDLFYQSGPSEFLYLEKNAYLICTDSFHSSVFAILYDRPFIVFERNQKNGVSMNSRLDTLISKFKLKDRKYNGVKITQNNINHDYSEAYTILENERNKSKKFISKVLDNKNYKED